MSKSTNNQNNKHTQCFVGVIASKLYGAGGVLEAV